MSNERSLLLPIVSIVVLRYHYGKRDTNEAINALEFENTSEKGKGNSENCCYGNREIKR